MIKKTLLFALSILFIFSVKAYASFYSVNQCLNHISAQSYTTAKVWGIRAVNNHPQSFYAHLCLGESDVRLGLYKSAIYDFKQAIPLATDKNKLMLIYDWIGGTFDSLGNEKDALMYDFRSLKLARELNNSSIESTEINNIASIYYNEGHLEKALSYFKKSLALRTTEKGKAISYNNIGGIYFTMNNYDEAIKYQKKALNLSESIGDYYHTASDYLNVGSDYIPLKNYFQAKRYIFKGIVMEKKIGNKDEIGWGYRYLGRLYGNEGQNNLTLLYYKKAYDMFKISGDSSGMQDCLYMINAMKKIIKNQTQGHTANKHMAKPLF